jgi:transposase-like protein
MESMISSNPVSAREVEVSSKAKRRVFTAEYKTRILREADACAGKHGALGALLRREGLYSSHLSTWRREAKAGLAAKKRGPKAKVDARDRRIAQLERQLQRASDRAERAEALVSLQKKVSQLMGIALPEPPNEDS